MWYAISVICNPYTIKGGGLYALSAAAAITAVDHKLRPFSVRSTIRWPELTIGGLSLDLAWTDTFEAELTKIPERMVLRTVGG